MRKIKRKEVCCSVCDKNYVPKFQQAMPSLKYFCPDCRGMSLIDCSVCHKKFKQRNAAIRNRKNLCCSVKCKSVLQRKDWNDLSRNALKQRWIKEFGEDKFKCNRCGHDKIYNMVLHHIKYVKNGGTNAPENLEPLCLNCHGIEHFEKGNDEKE